MLFAFDHEYEMPRITEVDRIVKYGNIDRVASVLTLLSNGVSGRSPWYAPFGPPEKHLVASIYIAQP